MKLKQLGYLRVFIFTCYALHFGLTEDSTGLPENPTNLATSMTATVTCGSGACVQSINFPKPRHNIGQFQGLPDDGFLLFQPLIEFNATEESCLTQTLMSIKVYFSPRITSFNTKTGSFYESLTSVYLMEKESKELQKGPLKLNVNKLYTTCTNFGNILRIKIRHNSKCAGAKIGKFYPIGISDRTLTVNPVADFLLKKEKSKDYPIMSLTKNSLLIDWGDLSKFGCDKLEKSDLDGINDMVSGSLSFTMNRLGEDTIIMESTSELNLDHDKPTLLEFDDKEVFNLDEIYCNPVQVTLTISNLKFGSTDNQEREPIVFRGREIKPRKFNATVSAHIEEKPLSEETDNRDTDRQLFLHLEAKPGSEPMCFQKTAMIREVKDDSKWKEENIYSNNNKKEIDVIAYREKQCRTTQIQVVIKSSFDNTTVLDEIYTIPDFKIEGNIITAGRKEKREGKLLLKLDSNVKPIPCLKNKAIVTDANSLVTEQPIVQENGITFIDITKLESCHVIHIDIDIISRANRSITLKNIQIDGSDDEGGCTGKMFEEDGSQLFKITCDHFSILNCLPEYAQVTKISEKKPESVKIIRKNYQALFNLTKFQFECNDINLVLAIQNENNDLLLFETALVNRLQRKEKVTGSLKVRKNPRKAYFSINTNDYSLNCLQNTASVTVSGSEETKSHDILTINRYQRIYLTEYIANCTDTSINMLIRDENNEQILNENILIAKQFPGYSMDKNMDTCTLISSKSEASWMWIAVLIGTITFAVSLMILVIICKKRCVSSKSTQPIQPQSEKRKMMETKFDVEDDETYDTIGKNTKKDVEDDMEDDEEDDGTYDSVRRNSKKGKSTKDSKRSDLADSTEDYGLYM